MLGSRPYPHHCETAHGYFLRLADLNGFMSIPELFSARSSKAFTSLIKLEDAKIQELCEHIAPAMNGRSAGKIYKGLTQPTPLSLIYNSFRLIQDLRVSSPRVCTDCIKETGIDWHWSLLPVYQCPKHKRKLLEHCPGCKAPLKWHHSIFTHCHRCKATWDSFVFEEEPIAPLQKDFFRVEHECSQALLDKVDDVILACLIAARPFDTFYQSLQVVPGKYRDTILLTEKAYALLCDTQTKQLWKSEVWRKRSSLGDKDSYLACTPISYMASNLITDWETQTFDIPKDSLHWKEEISFIRPKRLKASKPEDIKFQGKAYDLAKGLKISRQRFMALNNPKIIEALNPKSHYRDLVYDVRDCKEFEKRFS